MSYQVIARKWRPKTFDEVTGQEHITRTLRNAIEHERMHHAYLFSGARGVGKTTTARLLAKALNCRKTDGPNVLPCDTDEPDACPSCKEIAESRSMDVLEFDAASNTQVEKIREIILESINVAPARDRYKIFIIDEVHMLSTSSFNALLKTVEEPPPRVVFIMATTELHKVPDTILSRCQQFEFRTISNQRIFDRLKLIADTEQIAVTDAALREIARSGEGSMRDAQSNFDQVISFSDKNIDAPDVALALGIAGSDMLAKVIRAIADRESKVLLDVVEELIARGHDLRNFSRDLLALFRDLLVFKVSGGNADLIDRSILSRDELNELAGSLSENDLLRFFNSLAETETTLKDATQPRYVLEIGLVKLVEMRRLVSIENVLNRLAGLERLLPNSPTPDVSRDEELLAAVSEKKTLIPEPPDRLVPAPLELRADFASVPDVATSIVQTELSNAAQDAIPTENRPAFDLTFLDSMPVRLVPIDASELEHIDDAWLDSAFEEKLIRSGDDLRPLADLSDVLTVVTAATENGNSGNNLATDRSLNGSAAAIAAEFRSRVPERDPITTDIPELSENATAEELMQFAENHPDVKLALRALRGKIVEVRRI